METEVYAVTQISYNVTKGKFGSGEDPKWGQGSRLEARRRTRSGYVSQPTAIPKSSQKSRQNTNTPSRYRPGAVSTAPLMR